MSKIVLASTRQGAGKTSLLVGVAKALGRPFGYLKPLGDRLLYRKKRLWDYDAALLAHIFGLTEPPEEITLGFEQAKLRYMYDEEQTAARVREMAARVMPDDGLLFIEGPKDLTYGASVYLDALSLAKTLDARLVYVMSGDGAAVMDDLALICRYVNLDGIDFAGVLVNRVPDVEDFERTALGNLQKIGVPILGIVPDVPDLRAFSMAYLADYLFAKVVAGEKGLNAVVKNILVGAMSANEVLRSGLLRKENKLIITSGDRSDMILAAMDSNAVGIVLSNNILPPPNILSRASLSNVPLLLVAPDTYQVAKQVDNIEPLLTEHETAKIELLATLARDHVALDALVGA